MDQQTLLLLGQYLNENLSLETCDNSLKKSTEWLRAMQVDEVEEQIIWLQEQGISCDCEVVIKLYIPAREEEIDAKEKVTE
jgi:hypothetical protein